MNTSIGTVVTVDEVCHAIADVLAASLPDVLESIDDPDSRTIPPPTSYSQVPTRDAILAAEQQLPAVGVFSSGDSQVPTRDEQGTYTKVWRITVAWYARGDSFENTQWVNRTAGALIQALLTQNQDLAGVAQSVTPVGESYDIVDANASRTLAGVALDFDVEVQAAFGDTPTSQNDPDSLVLSTDTDVEIVHPSLV